MVTFTRMFVDLYQRRTIPRACIIYENPGKTKLPFKDLNEFPTKDARGKLRFDPSEMSVS
jgi:hypothetical protein